MPRLLSEYLAARAQSAGFSSGTADEDSETRRKLTTSADDLIIPERVAKPEDRLPACFGGQASCLSIVKLRQAGSPPAESGKMPDLRSRRCFDKAGDDDETHLAVVDCD